MNMKKPKYTECVPTHLSHDIARALKCIASDEGVSVSEYIRNLIIDDLNFKESKAKATLYALGKLENGGNAENARGRRGRNY